MSLLFWPSNLCTMYHKPSYTGRLKVDKIRLSIKIVRDSGIMIDCRPLFGLGSCYPTTMNTAKSSIASQLKSVLYKDKGMLVLNKLPGLTCQLATGEQNSHRVRLTSPSQLGGTGVDVSSRT